MFSSCWSPRRLATPPCPEVPIVPEPLVSIVIATYQSRRDHLSAAITSALGQTWSSIEVIADVPPAVETGSVERAGAAELRHGKAGTPPRGEDRPPAFEGERIVDGHGVGLLKTRKPTSLADDKRREFTGRIR